MEIVVNRNLAVLPTVRLGQLLYEQFVLLGRGLVSREEVEYDLHLYDGILWAGLYQAEVGEILPGLIVEILHSAVGHNLVS